MEETICSYCGKIYLQSPNRIHEAIKFGWKQYCSQRCQNLAKTKLKECKCSNLSCNKIMKRTPSAISSSGKCYCSNSCAAMINNKKRMIIRKKSLSELKYYKIWKKCLECGKKFYGASSDLFPRNKLKEIMKRPDFTIDNNIQLLYY